MSQQRIELHIDELVLHGVAPGDAHQIGLAIERELGRLLSMHGLPSSLSTERSMDAMDGGRFTMTAHARPVSIGQSIAGSVFKGMSRVDGRAGDPGRRPAGDARTTNKKS